MTKILHLHYFAGSGGKFIGNCLSMSGQVAFPNYGVFKKYYESKDIAIIEKSLLNTIPPSSEYRTWFTREPGCSQLFGPGIDEIRKSKQQAHARLNDTSIFSDVWLPVVTHRFEEVSLINDYFHLAEIFFVGILGDPEFIDKAIRLKWPEEHHCFDPDQFAEFAVNFQKLRFDHVIHDWNPLEKSRLFEIENLAGKLNVNYTNALAKNYINQYLQFHQSNLN